MPPSRRGIARGAFGLLVACSLVCGCRPPQPKPPVTEPTAINPDSLLAAVLDGDDPTDLQGRGSARLQIGARRPPAFNLRYTVRTSGEFQLLMRPGILPPVLRLWAGVGGWSVLLPGEKAVFEAFDARPGDTVVGEVPLDGPQLARFAWLILVPRALLRGLERPRIFSRGEHWIINGSPPELAPHAPGAEVWVEKEGLGISRWSLRARDGTALVQVSYTPSLTALWVGGGQSGVVEVGIEALDIAGTLRPRGVGVAPAGAGAGPAVPGGWRTLPASGVPVMFEEARVGSPKSR